MLSTTSLVQSRWHRRHSHRRAVVEDTPDRLVYLVEPEDVDGVEDEARRDEHVPNAAKVVGRRRPVDRIDFEPVWWDAYDARQEEDGCHRDAVEQEDARLLVTAHRVEEPPVGQTITEFRRKVCSNFYNDYGT